MSVVEKEYASTVLVFENRLASSDRKIVHDNLRRLDQYMKKHGGSTEFLDVLTANETILSAVVHGMNMSEMDDEMSSGKSPRYACVDIILNVCGGLSKHTQAAITAGALPVLISIAGHETATKPDSLSESAMWALGNLCDSVAHCEMAMEYGMKDVLLRAIQEPQHASMFEQALFAWNCAIYYLREPSDGLADIHLLLLKLFLSHFDSSHVHSPLSKSKGHEDPAQQKCRPNIADILEGLYKYIYSSDVPVSRIESMMNLPVAPGLIYLLKECQYCTKPMEVMGRTIAVIHRLFGNFEGGLQYRWVFYNLDVIPLISKNLQKLEVVDVKTQKCCVSILSHFFKDCSCSDVPRLDKLVDSKLIWRLIVLYVTSDDSVLCREIFDCFVDMLRILKIDRIMVQSHSYLLKILIEQGLSLNRSKVEVQETIDHIIALLATPDCSLDQGSMMMKWYGGYQKMAETIVHHELEESYPDFAKMCIPPSRESGATESDGVTGSTGSDGEIGATRATGAIGSDGVTGSTGSDGVTGVIGNDGTKGATCSDGVTGEQSTILQMSEEILIHQGQETTEEFPSYLEYLAQTDI